MNKKVPKNQNSSTAQRISKRGASLSPPSYGLSFIDKKPVQRKTARQTTPNTSEVVQRIGSNINMVPEEDRYFETIDKSERLRVNPDADAYLENHFDRDSASSLTNATLGDKFSHAMNKVHKGIPYNKAAKIEAFDSHIQPTEDGGNRKERGLGYMLHTQSATCWEKAAHFHLVLAELGIPTSMEGGYNKITDTGHAWLVVPPHEDLLGGKNVVIDPTNGRISDRTTYEAKYNITIPAKQVATPKTLASPKEIEQALRDYHKLNELGGAVKEMVLGMVDLKIERAMHEKRRAKEDEEWQRLLDNFKSIK